MILTNRKIVDSLNSIPIDDFYIITDFDGTLTKDNGISSWASIFKNPKVNEEFVDECLKLFNYYHKFEVDETLPIDKKKTIMAEWYRKNIETVVNFKITEEIINYAAINGNEKVFRKGAAEFLKVMHNKNVPIIIISAGVGNIIEQYLIKNNCNYPNIYICSNFFEYEKGIIKGVRDNVLIHPLNKNEVLLPEKIKTKIDSRKNVLVLDNSVLEISIADSRKNIYKLGFLDENVDERMDSFKDKYDIVCTDNTSYDEIRKKITILN